MDRKKKKAKAKSSVKESKATRMSLTASEAAERFLVHGVVLNPDKSFAVGVTVVAFDQDETGKNRLGESVTDAEGNYRIEYGAADYRLSKNERGGADIFVRVYNSQGTLLFHSDTVRSAPAELVIDANLPAVQFVVHGRVSGGDKGQLVRAYDVDLRDEELLGFDFTDADGNYEIPYSPLKFSRAETGAADLRVSVRLHDGGLLWSDTFYNAEADKIVDLEIEPAGSPPSSEYERYLTALAPALQDVTLLDIDAGSADQKVKDFTFLAGDTGIDRQHIEWLAQGAGFEARTRTVDPTIHTHVSYLSIPAAAFYGWFRQDLPAEFEELLTRSNVELIAELKEAIAVNILPQELAVNFDSIAALLDQLRALRALQPAAEGKPASLGDTLDTLPGNEVLSENEKLTFARLHHAHGDGEELWKQAEVAGLSNAIPALKRTFALDKITAGNPALVRALQAKADAERPGSVEFLTALEPADLIDLVFEHGVPPGSTVDRDGYIDRLQAEVENRFPTQVLSRQLEKKLGENGLFPTSKVVSLLNANPDLDFRSRHIEPFLGEQGIVDEDLRAAALRLARVHALTGSAQETGELLAAGVGSAGQIVAEGKSVLRQKAGNRLPAERIDAIYAAAENVVSTVVALGTAYGPSTGGNSISVVATSSKVASTDLLNSYPSLRTLFGDLDYCECRHCRSVLGPAAYLTDLMHFLQRSLLTNSSDLEAANYVNSDLPDEVAVGGAALAVGGTVLGALLQRRPDLVDLELSCENTNTEIPYIDLVLEILENAVGLPLVVDPSEYAGVDVDAEFANGTVPQAIVDALLQTDIKVGKDPAVERSFSLAYASPITFDNWIIKDGSRRWSVQHVNPQLVVSIAGPSGYGTPAKVIDATAAVAALSQGRFNTELEDKLSQGLPIAGTPQIDEIPESINFVRFWSANYTRAIAIKSTAVDRSKSAVELFTLDGRSLGPPFEWSRETVDEIVSEFKSGQVKKISGKVAQRFGIPAEELYLQTWNRVNGWWELSVKNIALVAQVEFLGVSALTYQNSALGEDLKSGPENRNPAAYRKLAAQNTVFPWTMPFDLWLEETRAFLDALGVSRSALIDLARPQSRLIEAAAKLELLGLSKSEADLILSASATTAPWIYWGLAETGNTVMDYTAGVKWNDDWQPILARISMLLQQSGLSYREYLDLRQTSFVGQPAGILFPPNECKTSDIALFGLDTTQFTEHLNRVHRFTRLWRKSGWSMRELDAALSAFVGTISAEAFTDLALVKRLRVALDLPVREVIGCINRLESKPWTDHAREGTPVQPALYDSVFQRPSLRSLKDFDSFSLDKVDVATTTSTISGSLDFVAASLGVKPSQVQLWIGGTPNLGIEDRATLDNLSRVYAAATLSHALSIKPDALPDIVTLLGTAANPFHALPAPTTPDEAVERVRTRAQALLEFVERVRFVQGSGFDFATLSYLLQHRFLAGGPGDASTQIEQQLTRTLTELRSSLQAGDVLGEVSAENLRRQLTRLDWNPALIDEVMGPEGLGYQPGAEVEIKPPPATEPAIPLNLRAKFSYQKVDSAKAVLKCTGSLDSADFAGIANQFAATTITDIESQYNTALSAHVTLLTDKMRVFEPGATLPLFITAADAEQLLREPDTAARYQRILLRLVSRLDLDLLLDQLGAALGLDPPVVGELLDAATVNGRSAKEQLTDAVFLRSYAKSTIVRSDWREQFNTLELLGKIATIGKILSVRPEQWDWVLGSAFSMGNVLALPTNTAMMVASFESWRRLVNLFRLRDVLSDGPARLTRIGTALKAAVFDTVREEFADAFQLRPSEVDDATSTDLLAFREAAPDNDYSNPDRLVELAQLLNVIAAFGTPASNIKELIEAAPGESVARLARNVFAASVDSKMLAERLRPISNRLRNLQRNALVAYLVHRDHLSDSNELFDRYLIDVEMGSCMLTSRVKQAISSVQLFVQRCLLNLERPMTPSEPGVKPSAIDAQRWQWMKFYRVWEANRKVFLYPENWIEPELRDDKTEIFQAFESDLLQSEITHETALVALRKYLDEMVDVANLTVVTMFEEKLEDDGSVVHLVGRDNSQPYKHYYRKWKLRPDADFGTWTAWEEISAQVASEHVLVFVFGGSVYLAWPTISSGQVGNLNWKISMSLAKRTASGWTKLKKGQGEIRSPMVPYEDERTNLAFRISVVPATGSIDKTVSIDTYGSPPPQAGEVPNETKQESISDFFDSEAEKYGGAGTSNPIINLQLRVLDSFVYEYAGKVKQTHYRPSDNVKITITATYRYTTPKDYDIIGGWNDPKPRTFSRVGYWYLYSFNALLSTFIDLRQITWGTPNPGRREFKTLETLASDVKFTVTVQKGTFTRTKILRLSKGNSLTWQEDFIFELSTDPGWLSSSSELEKVGSFTLKEDDSLALDPRSNTRESLPPPHIANTEPFNSAYREVGELRGLDILPSILGQSLQATPGQYFLVPAVSDGAFLPRIFAYRDDRFSLLFWKHRKANGSYEDIYRVVPFSTGGLRKLTSAVTRGNLSEAIALPLPAASLAPILFGTTGFGQNHGTSVTEVAIDFEKVPASIYNWEVFFHIPLLVATQLSRAQRFEEAQRWFHFIFDPTTNEPAPVPTTPQNESTRFWRFRPFRETGNGEPIEKLLEDSARATISLKDAIDEWAENPFRPHLVARQRLRSYQFAVVQKYLDNLIAWGDHLFRRDTIEAINEATQLYVLAAKILGKRPAASPKRGSNAKSYRDIQGKLDDFSNAWIALEPIIATQSAAQSPMQNSFQPQKAANRQEGPSTDQLLSLGSLYFCVPGNEKLSEYWNSVEDRLFKIRHCMNIDGVERQLPLFEPPIDPALLVKAIAAGLDISAVLSDLEAPLPLYRFNVMLQKAMELCGEVRALGGALLSALEKKDAEQLSLLRSSHEIQMLKLVRTIKEQQRDEAITNLQALRKTRDVTVQRYLNYQRLMGKKNVEVPAEGVAATLGGSTLQLAPPSAGGSDTEGLALISAEAGHLGWLNDANNFSLVAGVFNALSGILHMIPDAISGPTNPVATHAKFGGSHLGNGMGAIATVFGMMSTNASFQATRNATIGGHQRRFDEWQFQSNTAAKELEQIDKQIIASDIRRQISEREIENHDQQIENSLAVDEFMRDKYTNQQLYSWMVGQISGVYFRTYQLAHTLAKRAERAYRFELGLKNSSFIDFGYWDSLKKGLMSGERLSLDLKRMEASYFDQNKREYEITKQVSLLQLDPAALIELRQTRKCDFTVPEAIYDLDFAGHYLRRIKNVSLTIPCVTGPYSGVPATLTLLKSSIRTSSTSGGEYARDTENDDARFKDSFGSIQSIVTSSAQNDSGLFETNLRDERYLPFEGAGAISTWRIELPKAFSSFDYDTIADVVLHIRYTARGDGGLKAAAESELRSAVNAITTSANEFGATRLFSLKQEFPSEWHRLTQGNVPGDSSQEFAFAKDRFPFLFGANSITISKVDLYAAPKTGKTLTAFPSLTFASPQGNALLGTSTGVGRLQRVSTDPLAIPVDIAPSNAKWTFGIPQAQLPALQQNISDILVVCHYTIG